MSWWYTQELLKRISRGRWMLGLVLEECERDEECEDNSWISGELPDWFFVTESQRILCKQNTHGNVDQRRYFIWLSIFEVLCLKWNYILGAGYAGLELKKCGLRKQIWKSSAFDWCIYISSYSGRVSKKTEAEKKCQDPALHNVSKQKRRLNKGAYNVGERRINQKKCLSQRRNKLRSIASSTDPIKEEKVWQL